VASKYKSSAAESPSEAAALLATQERPDMVAALMGRTYPRGQWLFLWEGITVPIAYVPAPTPPPPPTP
jgi:hypothetical protein